MFFLAAGEQERAEKLRLEREKREAYLQKIKPLMDKNKWQRGDRLCLEFVRQGQYITGTVEEWNGDKSKCRIKIVTSPNGNMSYNGDILSKNNLTTICFTMHTSFIRLATRKISVIATEILIIYTA